MIHHHRLLDANKAWARKMAERDPAFFERLLTIQKPDFLWIGCSDSRVPPDQITQTQPGEIFIHRNVANVVVHTDMNLMSVLEYAVEVLGVNHVIVCGHYGCGGVQAALTRHTFGHINKWLRHIKDVYRLHAAEIEALPTDAAKADRLTELNVIEQVHHLAETVAVQSAWKNHRRPHLHGWVYDLHDGIIKELIEMPPSTPLLHKIYEYDDL